MSETKEVAGLVTDKFSREEINALCGLSTHCITGEGFTAVDGKIVLAIMARMEGELKAKDREIERLQSDLTRYIDIATKEATEAEGLRAERDAALAAEDAAKDCFWAIYPDWAEMKGHGLTTEAAKSMLAERVSTLTRQLEEAREGNNTLTFLLDEALPYLETVTDEGPFDEGWRSQDLQNLIAAIRSLKQGERE